MSEIDVKKFSEIDLYGLIEVEITATENEIRKAYRKKALECHPDKNPDNPKANELFLQLSKALQILSDKSARAAYDKILNAKKAAKLRNNLLDSKRLKFKSDLEKREKAAELQKQSSNKYSTTKTDEEQFRSEIERLRKEGSLLLEEEQRIMRKYVQDEKLKSQIYDSSQHRIKIKWKVEKADNTNGGYTESILKTYLIKYGDIIALVMSPKKQGSALIEFKTQEASEMAVLYEKGNLNNPLTLQWVGKPPASRKIVVSSSSTITDLDFESLVLRQMRQTEERKRLIEAMLNEENES